MTRGSTILLIFTAALAAQPAATNPVFEAASIKGPDPSYSGSGWDTTPGRIVIHNMTLRQLVMLAYDVKRYQISGGPKWLDDDRYAIVAKLEAGGNNDQLRMAMQSLLADRFQLQTHRETRPMSGYALVVSKNGFKLQPVEATPGSSVNGHRGKTVFRGVTMERLAGSLDPFVDSLVVDATGIQGAFNFTLEWSADDGADGGPSLFTALQEQLGLKLEARKMPAEMIVIDRAEKPGEN